MSTENTPDRPELFVIGDTTKGKTTSPLCPDCRDSGKRAWQFPAATVDGHCCCRVGRAKAAHDYAQRHPTAAVAS